MVVAHLVRTITRTRLWLLLALVALATPLPSAAHNLPYALATLRMTPDGEWRLEVSCHTAALVVGAPQGHLQPDAQTMLAFLPDAEVEVRAGLMAEHFRRATVLRIDGRKVRPPPTAFPSVAEIRRDGAMTVATAARSAPIVLAARLPAGARKLSVSLPPEVGIVLLRVEGGATQALAPAQESAPIPVTGPRAGPGLTFVQYLILGFTHILPMGLDHILFVLCLFLIAPRFKQLAWQVTGFTLAHSATLAMAVLGLIALPAKVVETAIALSITAMALDNVRTSQVSLWRPATVFGFGLLHGLGFASVLAELGLPPGQEALALLSFNVGIEIGQLAVLILAFALIGWTIRRVWYRARVAVPASFAIGLVGAFWAIQRALM